MRSFKNLVIKIFINSKSNYVLRVPIHFLQLKKLKFFKQFNAIMIFGINSVYQIDIVLISIFNLRIYIMYNG